MIFVQHGNLFYGGTGFWVGQRRLAVDVGTVQQATSIGRRTWGEDFEVVEWPGDFEDCGQADPEVPNSLPPEEPAEAILPLANSGPELCAA